ncbi:MAG: hypothetical protein RLZZ272_1072 [Actinomycetota bacterium]
MSDVSRAPGSAGGVPSARAAVGRERRAVVLAVVAMLLLVLGGVVAGALFAPSGCRELRPSDLGVGAATVPVLAPEQEAALAGLEPARGGGAPPVLVRVGVASGIRLVAIDGGVAVVDGPGEGGSTLTVVDDSGTVRSRTGFGRATTVVGSAPAPYVLEVTNRATGQVDALAALDVTLEGVSAGVCVDTAVVGTPLTFLLDAGAGELLLLRTAEDGTDVEVELRDPVRGRRWATGLELGRAPAGLVAARTTAMLGEALVVVGHRSVPVPLGAVGGATAGAVAGDPPAIVALARSDGAERWRIGREALEGAGALADVGGDGGGVDIEVVAVTDERVHVLLVPVEDDDVLRASAHGPLGTAAERRERRGTLVRLAVDDGRVLDVVTDAQPGVVTAVRDEGASASWRSELGKVLGADLLDVSVTPERVWALVAGPAGDAVPGVHLVGFAP